MERISEYLAEVNISPQYSNLNLLNQILSNFFLIQIYFKAEDEQFEKLFKFSGKLKICHCTHSEGRQTQSDKETAVKKEKEQKWESFSVASISLDTGESKAW